MTAPGRADIVAAMRKLLAARGPHKSICPSEIARRLAPGDARQWRALMPAVRAVAAERADAGEIVVTRRGQVVDVRTERGPVRIARIAPTHDV